MTVHFSDGFESNDFSAWTGVLVVGASNSLATDATHPYLGTYGAKVHIENAVVGDKARCYVENDFSLGAGALIYISGRLFFPTGFDCEQSFNLMTLGEGAGDYKAFHIQMLDNMVLRLEDTINAATYTQPSPVAVPIGQHCGIEMCLYVDNSSGYVQLWQDGIKVIEQTGIDTQPATPWKDLQIGLQYLWGGSWAGPDDFYFDEVYVQDSQKIPQQVVAIRFNPLNLKRFGGF